jgi:uncharacterized protein
MQIPSKIKRFTLWVMAVAFLLFNVLSYYHAHKFTHFTEKDVQGTAKPEDLTLIEKAYTLIFGVNNPRPVNDNTPSGEYSTIRLLSNKEIECWYIETENAKGTVILFHGYSSAKSSMLEHAELFQTLGYNTFLVDFMGSGGSGGNRTTIGYIEAKQVQSAFQFINNSTNTSKIYLYGASMGAVAIMKAIRDNQINPDGIIIESPFGSMYQSVKTRFRIMKVPSFPAAAFLTFWGGLQNGFWAFSHKPTEYAKSIQIPTLLIYGAQDINVSRQEIDEIYLNLNGAKMLSVFEDAGHTNIISDYNEKFTKDLKLFFKAF